MRAPMQLAAPDQNETATGLSPAGSRCRISWQRRQAKAAPPGLILCLTILLSASQTAAFAEPNPSGTWSVRGRDEAGIDWAAKLVLMPADADEYPPTKFRGHFDWRGSNRVGGREYIPAATYDYKTRLLTMAGAELENADPPLTAAQYRVEMTEDAGQLVNGTWGGPGVVPGRWQANRSVAAEPPGPRRQLP
jgi:hypothetical protein